MRILIFIISFYFFYSCTQKNKSNSFEGYIDYKTEIVASNDSILNLNRMFYGTQMRCYFKEGNYMREYYDNSDKVVGQEMFSNIDNKLYLQLPYYDKIFFKTANDTANFRIFNNYDLPEEKILGYVCKVNVNCSVVYSKNNNEYDSVRWINFFASDIYLNPEYYSEYKIAGYNNLLKEFKSVILKQVEEAKDFKIIWTAVKIVPQKINEEIFSIPKNKKIVPISN